MTRTSIGQRVRVNFYFDQQVFDGLRKVAALKNTTYSDLIRVACREYLIREAKRALTDAETIKEIIHE